MTLRRSTFDAQAALRAVASLVGRTVLIVVLAAAPTLTALASVATDAPPRVQVGLPGQAEVLEEEIHAAVLPTALAVVLLDEALLADSDAARVDWGRGAPPTPPPPQR